MKILEIYCGESDYGRYYVGRLTVLGLWAEIGHAAPNGIGWYFTVGWLDEELYVFYSGSSTKK